MAGSRLAITGLGCLLPGAATPDECSRRRADGDSVCAPLSPDRFSVVAFAHEVSAPLRTQPMGAVIESFDLDFRHLRLPPLQLGLLHRMEKAALVAMTQALNDAGIVRGAEIGTRTRVFVGASTLGPDPHIDQRPRIYRYELSSPISEELAHVAPGRYAALRQQVEEAFEATAPPVIPDSLATSASLIAGRIANIFDFQGGHIAVDAAEASSMAALELAEKSLSAGECDLALVCAVSPIVGASRVLSLLNGGRMASTAPRPFDPESDGTIPGEGSIAIVLQREDTLAGRAPYAFLEAIVSQPIEAGEPHAGHRGRAVGRAAARVLAEAGVRPGDVAMVESRAAGIADHDASELRALTIAYGLPPDDPGRVTSSARTFGDLDSAAGLLGVLSACQTLSRTPGRVAVSDASVAPVVYQALLASCNRPSAVSSRSHPRRMADEGIAIVGVGAVVPGSDTADRFWRSILAGVDAIQDIPSGRWDVDRLIGGNLELAALLETRHAGVVDLDALMEQFRQITGNPEAGEPSTALAVVAGAQALEDAGWTRDAWAADRVCVALGQLPIRPRESEVERRVLFLEHLQRALSLLRDAGLEEAEIASIGQGAVARHSMRGAAGPGVEGTIFSGFAAAVDLARTFGFSGGALSVDAACASSLAAMKVAADALLRGDADVALAGGIAFNLLPEYYVGLSMLGVLSKQGPRPFHAGADGFVPAEGAGMVVLKRLSDARAAGDRVYAVLRGLGIASDGAGLSVYAPNSEGEQRAMHRGLADAGLEPAQIDLVEAHGVGTQMGDAAEVASYRAVYGLRDPSSPLSIGTTKAHLGHLSSAAAALSVIKASYALRDCVLPPGDLGEDGDAVLLPEQGLRLLREPRAWTTTPYRRRRAAVSAIGLGGISYHAILEEPDAALRAVSAASRPLAQAPQSPASADRMTQELVPVALPDGRAHPLAGRRFVVVIGPDALSRAVRAQLVAAGCRVTTVEGREVEPELLRGIDGLIDLTEAGARLAGHRPTAAEVIEATEASFALLRAAYDALTVDGAPRWYAAVVSLGGDLGQSGCPPNVLGARLLGLARALKREVPALRCRIVDSAEALTVDQVAAALLAELESRADDAVVAYNAQGQRLVPTYRTTRLPADAAVPVSLPEGQRFFFAGGGRGILFECALALRRLGAKVVVSGRTALPDPSQPWLHVSDKAFEAFRRDEMLRRWQADRVTPVQFQAAFAETERQRELHRNLTLARNLGLALDYVVCDVTDAVAVREAVARARRQWDGIDVVVHGAMVEQSVAVPGKTRGLVAATISAKVVGLLNLLDATRDDAPRFVCFGSIAGVLGNAGQTDYAAADTLMSAILRAECEPGSRSVTINWPGWRGLGHVAASSDLNDRFEGAGITLIWPDEGVQWFVNEVAFGDRPHVMVVGEQMLQRWAWDASSSEPRETDAAGRPLLAGAWPMVDAVRSAASADTVVERTLDLASDVFLLQHRIRDIPTLPFTFGCELIAEAAELACPGLKVATLLDVRVDTPVKLFRGAPLALRTYVRVTGRARERCLADVRVTSDLRVGDRVSTDARVHFTARVLLVRAGAGRVLARRQGDERIASGVSVAGGFLHSHSFYHLMRDPLDLGPAFDRAAWLRVSDAGVVGTVQPRRERGLLLRTSHPRFVVDPFVMDAALQIAASWDGFREGWLCVPVGLGRLELGRPRSQTEPARVTARVLSVAGDEVRYDVQAVGHDDETLFRLEGLELRRFSRSPS